MELDKLELIKPAITSAKSQPQESPNVLTSFGEMLKESINKVNSMQLKADELRKKVATGEIYDLHQVMIAATEASIALKLTLQIRNKVIEAYQEIMRMQV